LTMLRTLLIAIISLNVMALAACRSSDAVLVPYIAQTSHTLIERWLPTQGAGKFL